ncbi:MAG: chemotaxis response regulator protein-glutamate methylesterase [Bdellovibrionales bacterium]|nr:chemotaxis response regulator protein-glutamate methylesterase [Bdellovibrionales bacterium]
MKKIRVLIVDDAVVIRKIVSDVLSTDSQIEIAGVAANGRIALQKIPQCNPDVITLDVEMPELDGISTVRELRKIYPKLPVIMFSTLTERGAEATLDALSAGASDYCTKPANVGSVAEARERVRSELLSKIFALTNTHPASSQDSEPAPTLVNTAKMPSQARPVAQRASTERIDIVTIGVSTGGPNALAEVIPALAADLPVPLVCVQHMPPLFTKMLAERLDRDSKITVVEGADGMSLSPGQMYIAPGGKHMVIARRGNDYCLALNELPPENSCRPAADPLFRSVAEHFGAHALGVVLTGMGQDGLRGSQALKEVGAAVLAQDKESSVVWGMPGYVAEAGLADAVVPLSQIAHQIQTWLRRGRASCSQPQVFEGVKD